MNTETLATFSLNVGTLFVLTGLIWLVLIGVSWLIALIRVLFRGDVSIPAKLLWIVGLIFIPILTMFYHAFAERSRFLKFCGWLMILMSVGLIGLGYTAAQTAAPEFAAFKKGFMDQINAVRSGAPVVIPPDTGAAADGPPEDPAVVPVVKDQQTSVQPDLYAPQTPAAPETPVIASAAPASPKFQWALSKEETLLLLDASLALMNATVETDPAKRSGAVKTGLQKYDEIVQINPRNAQAYNGRAQLKEVAAKGSGAADFTAAKQLVDQAIGLYPEMADLYALRSQVNQSLGDKAAARHDLERAIQIDPNNSVYSASLKTLQ